MRKKGKMKGRKNVGVKMSKVGDVGVELEK